MSRKTTEKQEREHKTGVSTGYETDGTNYWLAPMYVNIFGEIQDQEFALARILETVLQAVANARVGTEAQKRKWWDRVYVDLGLDRSVPYSFSRIEGKLFPAEQRE